MRPDQSDDLVLRRELGDGIGRRGRIRTQVVGDPHTDHAALDSALVVDLFHRDRNAILHPLSILGELARHWP
jgi:hypothetical protein